MADRTFDGRPLKILTVLDEYSRECLAIEVERSLQSIDVLDRLADLFVERGLPEYIRSDNGPEFAAVQIRTWLNVLEWEHYSLSQVARGKMAMWSHLMANCGMSA